MYMYRVFSFSAKFQDYHNLQGRKKKKCYIKLLKDICAQLYVRKYEF